jgi:hypothetical protein
MNSTSSLPDLSQMPGLGPSPCGSAAATSSGAATAPHQAPECLKNLRPNAKWDVSFGIVLLELLSGRVYLEVELCQWHAELVAEERGRVLRMADPTLRGEADGREDVLLACFRLAFACCGLAPSLGCSSASTLETKAGGLKGSCSGTGYRPSSSMVGTGSGVELGLGLMCEQIRERGQCYLVL